MSRTPKKFLAALLFSFATAVAVPSLTIAQDAETGEEDRVLDTVTVQGVQNDAAMAAFRAGDFETAEVEFLDNAMCALRRERNLSASVNTARLDSARAETLANSAGSNSGGASQGAGAGTPQGAQIAGSASSGIAARNIETQTDRTCEARGHQLYMAGMSQIQLGKTDEALRSLEKATVASKILYDAHYKIGLIKLLQGDEKTAKSELKKIERILDRCRRCEDKPEIESRRDHLAMAIKGEVSLQ
jgi:tetratricopeptide (TPR) repeat protein